MKRLKKIANNYEYKFESPITLVFDDETVPELILKPLYDEEAKEYASDVSDAIDKEMKNIGSKGLAEYLDEPLKSKINSIVVTEQFYSAITIIDSKEKLNKEELNELKEYISEQFSTGWGKNFEQISIKEIGTTLTYFVPDEYNGGGDKEEYDYDVILSVKMRDSKNWYIKQV